MKISSIIMTALIVGAGGVIAATLFAPGKGSKTGSRLVRKGQEYKDYLLDNFSEFTDLVSHPFENLEEETLRLSKKANAKAKAKSKAKQIKAALN